MPRTPRHGRHRHGRAGNHAQAATRRRWPWVLFGTFAALAALAAVAGVFAKQAFDVRDDLLAAKAQLSGLTKFVKSGDAAALESTSDHVLALAARANATVQNPLWDMASAIPIVGHNVAAVKDATEAVYVLAHDAMPPAIQLLSTVNLDQLSVEGGGINLEPLKGALDVLPQISTAFAAAQSHVADIDRAQLLPVVSDAIAQLLDVMDQAEPALAAVDKYLPTALHLAGSEGPRRYIVVFQNNAEIRATGGNGATSAVIELDDGHLKMLSDEESAKFTEDGIEGRVDQQLPDSTRALYEDDLTDNTMNYPRLADFPTAAQMYRALWQQSMGGDVDGVISIDPVVLSYMLAVTGPVKLQDGSRISSANAVKVLLSETYEKFGIDGDAADDYFGDVSARVFDKVSSGGWDPMAMIKAFEKAIGEQRVYAWFTRPEEQAMAVEQGVDGALIADNAKATQVGIYLNDASYSKLEYYLSTSVDVTCDAAARTVTTTLTMNNAVPSSKLSGYTLAWRNKSLKLPRTTMVLDAISYAPVGGAITSDPENGDIKKWTRTGNEAGRDAKSITVTIPMGQTKTVAFTSTLPEGQLGPLAVRYSPTVTDTPVTISPTCDALFPAKSE
ncbi:DUF4012 domain-containing protein [Microbacterium sp. B2969]|uniref:DUF4012 domain-containing protein n=1 Tax=Microbacterium alkaliflavum TaxID=3248839 RepID=A0ABW7QBC6_9MICO